MYHNIEKNWKRAGWHGWDKRNRLWQIHEGANNGGTKFWASNGESYMYANSLNEMSQLLDR